MQLTLEKTVVEILERTRVCMQIHVGPHVRLVLNHPIWKMVIESSLQSQYGPVESSSSDVSIQGSRKARWLRHIAAVSHTTALGK